MQKIQNKNAENTVKTDDCCLWTKSDAAAYVKKTTRTIDDWMARGLLPFYKIGRSVLFRPSDVRAHLDEYFRVNNHSACKRKISTTHNKGGTE